MAFFLPSYFQKRILRYALSRLEVLDTDALDLERLEIAWGKTSTIDLQNLGLRLDKISKLLRLPPTLAVEKAKIQTLRLTIPADLYYTGISVEIRGVDVKIRLQNNTEEDGEQRSARHGRSSSADFVRTQDPEGHNHPRSPSAASSSDYQPDESKEAMLPSTTDLAQSFLHTEPPERQRELQSAVEQSSMVSSSQSSQDGSTESSLTGFGSPFSLPTFLADFLKGVGDRLKVDIFDVAVDLLIGLEKPRPSPSSTQPRGLEEVTLRMNINSISLKTVSSDFPSLLDGVETAQTATLKAGKRHICLKDLRVSVLSNDGFFSALAQPMPPPSPKGRYSGPEWTPQSGENSSSATSGHSLVTSEDMSGSVADFRGQESTMLSSRASIDTPPMLSRDTLGGQNTEAGYPQPSSPEDHKDMFQDEQDPFRIGFKSSLQATRGPPHVPVQFTEPRDLSPRTPKRPSERISKDHDLPSREESDERNESGIRDHESLAESRIYSHEDATSIYMSAMSDRKPKRDSYSPSRIPGGWSSSPPNNTSPTFLEAAPQPLSESEEEPADFQSFTTFQSFTERSHDDHDQGGSRYPDSKSGEPPRSSSFTERLGAKIHSDSKTSAWADPALERPPNHIPKPTQRSSTMASTLTVGKNILSMDFMEVQIPSEHQAGELTKDEGESFQLATATQQGTQAESREALGRRVTPTSAQLKPATLDDNAIRVALGSLQIAADLAWTRMAITILEKFGSFQRQAKSRAKSKSAAESSSTSSFGLRLTIESLRWTLLDRLTGETDLHEKIPLEAQLSRSTRPQKGEILFQSHLSDLSCSYSSKTTGQVLNLQIRKFAVGYSDEKILYFDSGLKMRDSTRDLLSSDTHDVLVTVLSSESMRSVEITTLPVRVALNLRKLDEAFGWFGGLSSMLDLGNSMLTTVTVLDDNPGASSPLRKDRAVRFSDIDPNSKSHVIRTQQHSKMTARLGGFVFDILGSECSLGLETSAVKFVSRTEGLGLQVDKIVLFGPYLNQSESEKPISMNLSNTRVEYLATPKEVDLARLLGLLSPSQGKHESDNDIVLDTLLRQRKKGGVIRATSEDVNLNISNMEALQYFPRLGDELKKLSTVTKYLPDDDRPGLLILGLVRSFKARIEINEIFGALGVEASNVEAAHVTFPLLSTLGIGQLTATRNSIEELIGSATFNRLPVTSSLPILNIRYIGNEMEPKITIKLNHLLLEYHVATLMAIMGLEETSADRFVADLASSVATLTHVKSSFPESDPTHTRSETGSPRSQSPSADVGVEVFFRHTMIGLNPRGSNAKALLVFSEAQLSNPLTEANRTEVTFDIRKASIMEIDDKNVPSETQKSSAHQVAENQISRLETLGYVTICRLSAAHIDFEITKYPQTSDTSIDVRLRDNLIVFESCADSTQTFVRIMSGLAPPMPKSSQLRYRTEVLPVQDMLASLSGDAFVVNKHEAPDESGESVSSDELDMMEDELPQNLEFVSSFYNPDPDAALQSMADSILEDDLESLATPPAQRIIGDKNVLESFLEQTEIAPGNVPLEIKEDHFGPISKDAGLDRALERLSPKSPLRFRMNDVHFIWNLYDGYDWQRTRDTITQAVAEVQQQATERQSRKDKRRSTGDEDDEEAIIGDFLFNSIYIGIPGKSDPADLTRQINHNIDDISSETGTNLTSVSSRSASTRSTAPKPQSKPLRLARSKHHKMALELKGISADYIVSPSDDEDIESSIDIRVRDLEIFDHVPTSTWRKFATYLKDAGEPEAGSSMVHVEIQNVKPVPTLAATEIVMKVSKPSVFLYSANCVIGFRATSAPACRPGRPRIFGAVF